MSKLGACHTLQCGGHQYTYTGESEGPKPGAVQWDYGPRKASGVYKAQMYVQDIDDAAYCQYFLANVKGVVQTWFDDLARWKHFVRLIC